jgi:hypothetical protein
MRPNTLGLSSTRLDGVLLVGAILLAFDGSASRADQLHRLSGAQIRTQFTGKVLTDGTHWRETYAPGGKLLVEEMDQAASSGSWRIDGDHILQNAAWRFGQWL